MRNIKETRLDAQQIPCHIYLKNLNVRHLISFTLKELEIFLSRHYGHPVVDFIISKNPYNITLFFQNWNPNLTILKSACEQF